MQTDPNNVDNCVIHSIKMKGELHHKQRSKQNNLFPPDKKNLNVVSVL